MAEVTMRARKQFRLQRTFELDLPERPKFIPIQTHSNVIDLAKKFIGDDHISLPLTGFQMWLPEVLHFEPRFESYWGQLIYRDNPFMKLLIKDPFKGTKLPDPSPSKNPFSKFMKPKNQRPKKIKAKGSKR